MLNSSRPLTRRTVLAGASAAALAGTAGVRGARAQTAPLKVGVLHPTSGYLAQIGQACNRGVQASIPVLKEMGYPALEVVYGDTESSPDVARAAAERLINGGAQVLIGAFESGHTLAIAQVAEQHGIPFVIDIAAAPQITEQGYKFIVRNFPRAGTIVSSTFELQKQLFQVSGKTPSKCVVLHVNDTYGTAIKGALNAIYPKENMPYQFADFIAYDPQARDLSVEVAKAKATGAEVVLAVSRLNDAILVTREMVKQRWEPWGVIAAGPGWYENQYMKTLGKLGDYPISCVPWYDPRKPLAQKMVDATLKMFPNQTVDTNIVYSFEAMLICADAYKRAKSAAPQALMEALKATNIKDSASVGDGISFDAKGQNDKLGLAAVQNFHGEAKVVLPLASSERNVVFPVPGWHNRG
ncbi:MAG TPA: ABC transporter substrate-binding protein [Alphaproteobacteria bacterium]|nr:ABC transporter substrate-binding protein [Alphaproteobacteria bacterium]